MKTAAEIMAVLQEDPYTGLAPERVFFTQWNGQLDQKKAEALRQLDFGEERLWISPRAAYLYIPGSAARSRLGNNFLERKLGISLTTRNRNTLSKLVAMADE